MITPLFPCKLWKFQWCFDCYKLLWRTCNEVTSDSVCKNHSQVKSVWVGKAAENLYTEMYSVQLEKGNLLFPGFVIYAMIVIVCCVFSVIHNEYLTKLKIALLGLEEFYLLLWKIFWPVQLKLPKYRMVHGDCLKWGLIKSFWPLKPISHGGGGEVFRTQTIFHSFEFGEPLEIQSPPLSS